jgi:hypothetical protein
MPKENNMSSDKEFFYQRFTLQGRVFYPNLLEPVANRNGVLKFSAVFAWGINSPENQASMAAINAFLGQAKQKFHPQVPMQYFMNPVKKYGEYQRQDGKPMADFFKDCYWLNLTSGAQFQPMVVDKFRNPITSKEEIYSGRNAVLSFTFYNINNEKKGVGANLVAIMLLDGGKKEVSSNTPDVNSIFGGFAADMGMQVPQQQPAYNPMPGYNPAAQPLMPEQQGQYTVPPQQPAMPQGYPQQQPAWPPQPTIPQQGYPQQPQVQVDQFGRPLF